MCQWTTSLNSDKTSKVFCINMCCFSTRFYFLVPQSTVVHAFGFQTPITAVGNGHYHRNRIMADMSGTWWDATTQVSSKSVHFQASYGISNIVQHGGRPPSWIFKIVIFGHVAVIEFLICCCRPIPNFIKIGSPVRPPFPDAHNC